MSVDLKTVLKHLTANKKFETENLSKNVGFNLISKKYAQL